MDISLVREVMYNSVKASVDTLLISMYACSDSSAYVFLLYDIYQKDASTNFSSRKECQSLSLQNL